MEKFLLVQTDGYEIEYSTFSSYAKAYEEMKRRYEFHSPEPGEWIEGYKEYSFLGETDARLFNNGIDTFIWKIIKVSEEM